MAEGQRVGAGPEVSCGQVRLVEGRGWDFPGGSRRSHWAAWGGGPALLPDCWVNPLPCTVLVCWSRIFPIEDSPWLTLPELPRPALPALSARWVRASRERLWEVC